MLQKKGKIHELLTASLLLILFIMPKASRGMPSDQEQIAELSANSAEIDQIKHIGRYTGGVRFEQGSKHLKADHIITTFDAHNKLLSAIAYGNEKEPVCYNEQRASDKEPTYAFADIMYYYPLKHLIELKGHAKIIQGENTFSAPLIQYDTQKQHILSLSEGTERTVIIFHSKKMSSRP